MLIDPAWERQYLSEVQEREDQWEAMYQRATPTVAARAAQIARNYPNLPGSVVGAASQIVELPIDHPLLDQTARRVAADSGSVLGSIRDRLWGGVKAGIRGAFVAWEGAMQELWDRPVRELAIGANLSRDSGTNPLRAGAAALLTMSPGSRALGLPGKVDPNFAAAREQSVPTVAGRAIGELRAGRPVNLGSGFIPRSVDPRTTPEYLAALQSGKSLAEAQAIAEATHGIELTETERTQRESLTVRLANHTISNPTVGRVITGSIADEDEVGFNMISGMLDFTKQVVGDPTIAVGKGVKLARLNAKMLLPAGSEHPTFFRQLVPDFLDGARGQKAIGKLAETSDINDLRRILGTDDPSLLRYFQEHTDPNDIRKKLDKVLGVELRFKPASSPGWRSTRLSDTRMGRLATDRPDQILDHTDIGGSIENLDNWMVNARLTRAERNEVLTEWVKITNGNRRGARKVLGDMMKKVDGHLAEQHGMNPQIRKAVTRYMDDQFTDIEALRNYWLDNTGKAMYFATMHIDDAGKALTTPHLFAEFLNRAMILPDAREMRRAYSKVRSWVDELPDGVRRLIFDDTGPTARLNVDVVTSLVDSFMTALWKPLVLLRPAWAARIGLEEQGRMWGAGLDSMLSDPISWWQWAKHVKEDALTVLGPESAPWEYAKAFQDAMTHGHGGWFDDFFNAAASDRATGRTLVGRKRGRSDIPIGMGFVPTTVKDGQQFFIGWAENLASLANDALAPRIAAEGPEAVKAWIRTDEGAASFLGDVLRTHDKERLWLTRRLDQADSYIDSVWARIHNMAGQKVQLTYRGQAVAADEVTALARRGQLKYTDLRYELSGTADKRLVEAIANGSLGDQNISRTAGDIAETKVARILSGEDFAAYRPDILTSSLKAVQRVNKSAYKRAVDWSFTQLGAKPTNFLARSPAFKQFYWQRMTELMPYADAKTQSQLLAAARTTKVPTAVLRKLEAAQAVAKSRTLEKGARTINLRNADQLAKHHALHETKYLLYDLNKKKNFFDITRNIFPFGEAHFEVLSRWAKLLSDNPTLLRRGQQALQGGRETGFFWTSPEGVEMYGMPAEGPIAEIFSWDEKDRARMRYAGRLNGLNIAAGGVIPGMGPFVQWPVSQALFATDAGPEWDWLRELALPYGDLTLKEPGDLLEVAVPAWADKFFVWIAAGGGPESTRSRLMSNSTRLFNNSIDDVLNAGMINGRYDPSTVEGFNAALEDASKVARRMWLIRGIWQAVGPSGVQPYFEAQDPDGRWFAFATLADEWRRLRDKYDDNDVQATADFLKLYGTDPFGFATAKSKQIVRRGVTETSRSFEVQNRETFRAFPATAYFAQPDDPDEPFSYTVYLKQFEEGTRAPRTAEDWLRARNDLKGRVVYDIERQKYGDNPNPKQLQYLRDFKAWLRKEYPGYDSDRGEVSGASLKDQMIEFEDWAKDPVLANSPAGQGVVLYMEERARQLERLRTATGSTTLGRQVAEPVRRYLNDYAAWLIDQYPAFRTVWYQALIREVQDNG